MRAEFEVRRSPRKLHQTQQSMLGDEDTAKARLAELRTECAAILSSMPAEVKPKDLMSFFSKIVYKKAGGQQLTGTCMFCNRLVVSTGAARLVDHLVACSLVLPEAKKMITKIRDVQQKKRKGKVEEGAVIAKEADVQVQLVKQQKIEQQGIRASLNSVAAEAADKAVADFFYVNGLSFSAADHSQGSY